MNATPRILLLLLAPLLGLTTAFFVMEGQELALAVLWCGLVVLGLLIVWRLIRHPASRRSVPRDRSLAPAGLLSYSLDFSGVVAGAVLCIAIFGIPILVAGGAPRTANPFVDAAQVLSHRRLDLAAIARGRSGHIGTTLQTRAGLRVTFIGYRTTTGRSNSRPDPGNVWLVTSWLLHNTGSRPVVVKSAEFSALSGGVLRPATFFYYTLIDDNLLDLRTSMDPGATLVRDVLFQVPERQPAPRILFAQEPPAGSLIGVWSVRR